MKGSGNSSVTRTRRRTKRRRDRGSGSIFERIINGRLTYVGQVELERDPVTGKRRRKTLYDTSKTNLQKRITALLNQVQVGPYSDPTRMTVAEFMMTWLDKHCKTRLKPKTLSGYEETVRRYIIPKIGSIELGKLQPLHLESLYATLTNEGRGQRAVQYTHVVLRAALNKAVRWRILSHAVTSDVDPPEYAPREQRALDQDEILRFLQAAKTDRNYALYLMAITTGMRPGELLGLKWSHVDLEAKVAFVQQTQVWLDRSPHPIYDIPKSRAGIRSIPLSDAVVEALRQHGEAQMEERTLRGTEYRDNGLVFCTRDGKALHPNNIRKRVKQLFKKANISDAADLHPYTFRRTHATYLISSGTDVKTVQSRMGHTTAKLLLDVYTKVVDERKREPARKFDELLRLNSHNQSGHEQTP
ncbi:tyrosine-type recombinase/integrase [Symbiobacterium terraclitae]|uniref:tyrosine-type recombinase/integrase n=1 Tax=Symbiobacterium terraclitae TaxID=557451 RepID=UPI0035B53D31